MAERIPQAFIDDLLNRTDILEVVEPHVRLKRSGRNHLGLCPFHQEKTPSFSVNAEKQFYYCFGCGAGGNALSFLMNLENLEFPEAVEQLARRQGLEIPRQQTPGQRREEDSRRQLLDLMREAADFYRQELRRHPQRQRAVDYLRQRGLDGQTAKTFGIGFAPPGWRNLCDRLGTSAERIRQLEAAGLIIHPDRGGRPYDRFRDRIVFPILDVRGRVIAFGGRVLNDEDKPKYLNSPETELFHKHRELYGLHQARGSASEGSAFLVVEGYMDVVALHQQGITSSVATLGTATSRQHLERLFRRGNEVVFCFDGDTAGERAAQRALETALPLMEDGRQARFLFLPRGEDPDSLVSRQGAEAFQRHIQDARPLSEYLFAHLTQGLDLATGEGRARLSALADPLIRQVPGKTFQALLHQQLAQITGLEAGFFHPVEAPRAPGNPEPASPARRSRPLPPPPGRAPSAPSRLQPSSLATQALTRLLHQPGLAQSVDFETTEALESLGDPELSLLAALIDQARRRPDSPTVLLINRWRDTAYFPLLQALAQREILIGDPEEFRDCLRQLLDLREERHLDALVEKQRQEALSEQERAMLTRLLARRGPGGTANS